MLFPFVGVSKSRSLDDELDKSDAMDIAAELLELESKYKILGHIFKVPVESICADNSDQKYQLIDIIDHFLRQRKVHPTWRFILSALRNPLINNPQLAVAIEKKYGFDLLEKSGKSKMLITICVILY